MHRKANVLAWIALVLGVLCLVLVIAWAFYILPNASIHAFSKRAAYVLLNALFNVFVGSFLALLSLVFGIVALSCARRLQDASARRCKAFSVVGIAGGALLLLCNLAFFFLMEIPHA